jgi:hypothetical protein
MLKRTNNNKSPNQPPTKKLKTFTSNSFPAVIQHSISSAGIPQESRPSAHDINKFMKAARFKTDPSLREFVTFARKGDRLLIYPLRSQKGTRKKVTPTANLQVTLIAIIRKGPSWLVRFFYPKLNKTIQWLYSSNRESFQGPLDTSVYSRAQVIYSLDLVKFQLNRNSVCGLTTIFPYLNILCKDTINIVLKYL